MYAIRSYYEAFLAASEGPLKDYLFYEREELVSTDFKQHPGSAIFDAPSTMIVDGTMAREHRLFQG